jgi:hypothetical protein
MHLWSVLDCGITATKWAVNLQNENQKKITKFLGIKEEWKKKKSHISCEVIGNYQNLSWPPRLREDRLRSQGDGFK